MDLSYFTFAIAFPITKATRDPDGNYVIKGDILGTCFSIGGTYMITASHVLEPIGDEIGIVGITNRETKQLKAAKIIDKENLLFDISIIKVIFEDTDTEKWMQILRWYKDQLPVFYDVATIGYPHGVHVTEVDISVIPRGIKGHIISSPNKFLPLGWKGEPFRVYELNFQIPNQLSGGPLLSMINQPLITGVVIGNSSSKILVLENEEIVESTKEKVRVQEYNSMTIGIAVREEELFAMSSRILGGTIGNYLSDNNLLI